MLLKLLAAKKLPAEKMITHRMYLYRLVQNTGVINFSSDFKFRDVLSAYDTFTNASESKSLKVLIEMQ